MHRASAVPVARRLFNKWRTVSVIDRIERDSGKAVVTNTQAWTWEALHGMGMRAPVSGFGRLLQHG